MSGEQNGDRLHVLLVEDDDEDYILTKDLLAKPGGVRHELHRVDSYRSGLNAARDGNYDICLVDYRLGAENGIELVRELLATGGDLPVIVLTGQGDRDVDVEAARAGAADYLVKGEVDAALLERTIRYSVQRHHDLQALREKEETLQQLNRELERRVNERTIELSKTITELAAEKVRVESLANINRAVLDATIDGIHMLDLDGTTLVANSAAEQLAADAFEVGSIADLGPSHAALAEHTTAPDDYRARSDEIVADPEHTAVDEFELSSSRRSFERYTSPVKDVDGSLIGRIFVLRDVTDQRQVERLKTELVATVSHELRTPLAAILGFSELLTTRVLEPETREQYLNLIHSEARRLTSLINEFLDLQRIQEGSFSLSVAPFEVDELLREQVELYSAQSEAHTLVLSLPPEPLGILGERARVAQVVGNLLSNAIKYSPDGGPVSIVARSSDGGVRVSVSDGGVGIPAELQHGIFTRFFRADSAATRTIGGTGLGLALCREIIAAHQGEIGFESTEGRGSTFWFELPAA